MKKYYFSLFLLLSVACLLAVPKKPSSIQQDSKISIDLIEVDAGDLNAAEQNFKIGRYNITVRQYTAFLNAVAATDNYSLYQDKMGLDLTVATIVRIGSPGCYHYFPDEREGKADCPITYVPWLNAARFCNWLHNGQPVGDQDSSTTEDGAYSLIKNEGAIVVKNQDARYFLPSAEQWQIAFSRDLLEVHPSDILSNGSATENLLDTSSPDLTLEEPLAEWNDVSGNLGSSSMIETINSLPNNSSGSSNRTAAQPCDPTLASNTIGFRIARASSPGIPFPSPPSPVIGPDYYCAVYLKPYLNVNSWQGILKSIGIYLGYTLATIGLIALLALLFPDAALIGGLLKYIWVEAVLPELRAITKISGLSTYELIGLVLTLGPLLTLGGALLAPEIIAYLSLSISVVETTALEVSLKAAFAVFCNLGLLSVTGTFFGLW